MLRSVEGVYRNGKVELLEVPEDVGQARVIVTFLPERAGGEADAGQHPPAAITEPATEKTAGNELDAEDDWHDVGA